MRNNSQDPLRLSWVSQSSCCSNSMHLGKSPFLCKILVSQCSSKSQFSIISNTKLLVSSSWLIPIIEVTSWLYSGVWKSFMLRLQRELNTTVVAHQYHCMKSTKSVGNYPTESTGKTRNPNNLAAMRLRTRVFGQIVWRDVNYDVTNNFRNPKIHSSNLTLERITQPGSSASLLTP